MRKETPVEMRRALDAVEVFKKAGTLFVPMPALDKEDHDNLAVEMLQRLESMEKRCEHCGAGDDAHHSFTCPTGLHPDRRC